MTTPAAMPPNLTPKQHRLAQEHTRIQGEWTLRQEKLGALREAWAIEAQAAPNFQLEQQIKAEEAQLAALTAQLTALEQELSLARLPCNVPHRGTRHFVGRDEDLQRLQGLLQAGDRVAISAIAGMGGIGKTELAAQYALRQHEAGTYSGGIAWLRAQEDVGLQIISFARTHLGLTLPDDLDLTEQVAWCWQHWPIAATLLIYDDVPAYDAIAPFLPPSRAQFRVLLTTRRNLGTSVQTYEMFGGIV